MTTLAAETGQDQHQDLHGVDHGSTPQCPGYVATLDAAGRAGILTMVHCEDWPILAHVAAELTAAGRTSLEYFPDSRPVVAEVVATQRAVAMAEATGAAIYAVHVSSEGALRVLQDARNRGLSVFVETRPIYLHFTRARFEGAGSRALRGAARRCAGNATRDALWAGNRRAGRCTCSAPTTSRISGKRSSTRSQTISQHRAGLNNLQVVRRPMLWSEGVVEGRISEERFVAG